MRDRTEGLAISFWVALGVAAMSAIVGACFDTRTSVCSNGLRCPLGLVCVKDALRCAEPGQEDEVGACVGRLNGEFCSLSEDLGVCDDRVCVPIECGDERVDFNEQCDGSPINGFECSRDCLLEICGNGIIDPGEDCDCGDSDNYIGPHAALCANSLNSDSNGFCRSDCVRHCGDGKVSSHEACDTALVHSGYCTQVGYDFGVLACSEACDTLVTDGCGRWNIEQMTLPRLVTPVSGPGFISSYTPSLTGIWGTGPTNIFATGFCGEILRYDGSVWKEAYSSPPALHCRTLSSVWGSASGEVVVGGHHGWLLHYDGSVWSDVRLGTTSHVVDIWGASATDVFAITSHPSRVDSNIFYYDGQVWRVVHSVAMTLSGVWGVASDDVYVVGYDSNAGVGRVLHYDGESWTQGFESEHELVDIWGSAEHDIFIAAGSGGVLHSDGNEWQWMPQQVDKNYKIWGNAADDVFVVGREIDTGIAVLQHYDGVTWERLPVNIDVESHSFALWGDGTSLFVVGEGADEISPMRNGVAYRYSGKSWNKETAAVEPPLTAVWGSDMGDVYAVSGYMPHNYSDEAYVLHYDGEVWAEMYQDADVMLQGVWGDNDGGVYAVGHYNGGEGGVVIYYNGDSWASVEIPDSTVELNDVWGSGPDDVFAVGSQGTVIHFDGQSWSKMRTPMRGFLTSVWGSGPSDVFAAGSGSIIIHWDGSSWSLVGKASEADVDVHISDIWGAGPRDVYAVDTSGQILHYDGNGWSVLDAPTAGQELRAVSGSSSNDVIVVGRDGIVLRYDGSEWSPMRSGTFMTLEDVWVSSRHRAVVVGEQGTIYHHM